MYEAQNFHLAFRGDVCCRSHFFHKTTGCFCSGRRRLGVERADSSSDPDHHHAGGSDADVQHTEHCDAADPCGADSVRSDG